MAFYADGCKAEMADEKTNRNRDDIILIFIPSLLESYCNPTIGTRTAVKHVVLAIPHTMSFFSPSAMLKAK